MKITGLPPLPPKEVPLHLQEPTSCSRCHHSFFTMYMPGEETVLRCNLDPWRSRCNIARATDASCGPTATKWKARETA